MLNTPVCAAHGATFSVPSGTPCWQHHQHPPGAPEVGHTFGGGSWKGRTDAAITQSAALLCAVISLASFSVCL